VVTGESPFAATLDRFCRRSRYICSIVKFKLPAPPKGRFSPIGVSGESRYLGRISSFFILSANWTELAKQNS
jgi:hypothetical protein